MIKVASFLHVMVLGGSLLGGSLPSHALQVTPGRQELLMKPGSSMKLEYDVRNDASELVNVELSSKDWFVYEANKHLTVDRWLLPKKPYRFELGPGKSRRVHVHVKCPKDTQGELVGMVSFTYQTAEPGMITPMMSLSVYVRAEGTEKISGEIQKLHVEMIRGKLVLGAIVKATGNVHLRPSGTVRVLKEENSLEVLRVQIREGDPAYPGRERSYFGTPLDEKLLPGRYLVVAELADHDLELTSKQPLFVQKNGQIRMEDAL